MLMVNYQIAWFLQIELCIEEHMEMNKWLVIFNTNALLFIVYILKPLLDHHRNNSTVQSQHDSEMSLYDSSLLYSPGYLHWSQHVQ